MILTAYTLYDNINQKLIPAHRTREWMDASPVHFVNRCLPMLIANQSGWFVLNDTAFTASWDGTMGEKAITIEAEGATYASSHFGQGVLTWNLPYLFHTDENTNLLVRGPANLPKDGISPLEGIVETDWCPMTFTMNWKFTRPCSVRFEKDEPFCMLVPQPKNLIVNTETLIKPIAENESLNETYQAWNLRRKQWNADLKIPGTEAHKEGWEKTYFQGRSAPEGSHQPKIKACPFS